MDDLAAHKGTELHQLAEAKERRLSFCRLCRKQFTSPDQLKGHLKVCKDGWMQVLAWWWVIWEGWVGFIIRSTIFFPCGNTVCGCLWWWLRGNGGRFWDDLIGLFTPDTPSEL